MSVKTCNRCQQPKPPNEFNKHPMTKDGLTYYCKSCLAEMNRERYLKSKQKAEPWFIFD